MRNGSDIELTTGDGRCFYCSLPLADHDVSVVEDPTERSNMNDDWILWRTAQEGATDGPWHLGTYRDVPHHGAIHGVVIPPEIVVQPASEAPAQPKDES